MPLMVLSTISPVGDKKLSVSVSAVVSVLNIDEKNPRKVVKRAQESLLAAKAEGKNRNAAA